MDLVVNVTYIVFIGMYSLLSHVTWATLEILSIRLMFSIQSTAMGQQTCIWHKIGIRQFLFKLLHWMIKTISISILIFRMSTSIFSSLLQTTLLPKKSYRDNGSDCRTIRCTSFPSCWTTKKTIVFSGFVLRSRWSWPMGPQCRNSFCWASELDNRDACSFSSFSQQCIL